MEGGGGKRRVRLETEINLPHPAFFLPKMGCKCGER